MLLSIALTSIGLVGGSGAEGTFVTLEPNVVTGNPGETFWVDVMIQKVTDLYAFEFKIGYVSGTKVVGAVDAEGKRDDPTNFFNPPYFLYGPESTEFSLFIEPMKGYIHVGCTILGDYIGLSGSGTLAKVQFAAVEGGESPLHLYDVVLLDHNLNPMGCQTRDSYFDGVNVELVMVNLGSRNKTVGDTQEFDIKVKNEDANSANMTVRARIDTVRDDGLVTTMWAGQSYEYPPVREPEYLYVDGYDYTLEGWTEVGAYPWLDAPDDDNYLTSTTDGAQHRWFSFEDIALEGAVIDYVQLEGYTNGPYNTGIDYDVYSRDFDWLGSLYGNDAPEWLIPRWTGPVHSSDLLPSLMTEEGLNNFVCMPYFYDPGGVATGNDIIDCLRLYVVFKSGRAPETTYVSDYDYTLEGWTEVGAAPWLNATDDDNYVTSTTDGAQHRWFTFGPVDIGDSIVDEVVLEGYTNGPYNPGIDYDVYSGDFDWLGSLYATGEPAWVTPRWTTDNASDILPALKTQEGLDSFKCMLYFFDPDGLATGEDIVDALRLTIYFKAGRVVLPPNPPEFVVQPGEIIWLPTATWRLEPEDVGVTGPSLYETTITVQYTYFGARFNEATKKVITRHWVVNPAPDE